MSNYEIKISGSANMRGVTAEFQKVAAAVGATNAALAQNNKLSAGAMNPAGYAQYRRDLGAINQLWHDSLQSSGMWQTQQVKINSAASQYVDILKRQKATMGDISRARRDGTSKEALRQQLRMQNMIARETQGASMGSRMANIAMPNFDVAQKSAADFKREMQFLIAEEEAFNKAMIKTGKNIQWTGRQLSMGLTLPVVAAVAGMSKLAYDADVQLTRIAKVYNTTAQDQIGQEKELAQLRVDSMNTGKAAAKAFGANLNDTLDTQAQLAAAGISGLDLQKSTTEAMRIATLGEMDYNKAVGASIALQTTFRMNTEEMTAAFDYMNQIENATSLSLQDFSDAIPIASGVVKNMGGDVKDLGLMLTAMKERGIGAVQGANAVKASLTRLLRPAESVKKEFMELTGQDITEIVKKNEGNLVGMFQTIGKATEDLSKNDLNKVFAGLFGTYQVSRLTALTDGLTNMTEQVKTATEVGLMSQEELAAKAEKEIRTQMESVSGQFNQALQTIKAQLADLGQIFLPVATGFIKGVSAIVEAIDSIPESLKKAGIAALVLAAMAGPLVMLTGLFLTFGGVLKTGFTALKGAALGLGIFRKEVGILTQEEAARLAMQKAGISETEKQTLAVQDLTHAMQQLYDVEVMQRKAANELFKQRMQPKLDAAQAKVNVASGQASSADQAVATVKKNIVELNNRIIAQEELILSMKGKKGVVAERAILAEMKASLEQQVQAERLLVSESSKVSQNLAKQQAALSKIKGEMDAVVQRENALATATATAATSQEQAALATEKQKNSMAGAKLAAIGFGAAMGASLLTNNEQVDAAADFVMQLSFVAPAIWAAVAASKGLLLNLKQSAFWAAMTQKAASGGKMSAIGSSLSGMLTKGNLITAGIAAAGLVVYKVWRHNRDELEKQRKLLEESLNLQRELANSAKIWSDVIEKSARALEGLPSAGAFNIPQQDYAKILELMKSSEDFQKIIGSLRGTVDGKVREGADLVAHLKDPSIADDARMLQQLIVLQNQYGLSAEESNSYIMALYQSAGLSIEDASAAQKRLNDLVMSSAGTYKTADRSIMAFVKAQTQAISEAQLSGMDPSLIQEQVNTMRAYVEDALAHSTDPDFAQKIADQMTAVPTNIAQSVFDQVKTEIPEILNMTKKPIENAQQLANAAADPRFVEHLKEMASVLPGIDMTLIDALSNMGAIQKSINDITGTRQWAAETTKVSHAYIDALNGQMDLREMRDKDIVAVIDWVRQLAAANGIQMEITNRTQVNAALAAILAKQMGLVTANTDQFGNKLTKVGRMLKRLGTEGIQNAVRTSYQKTIDQANEAAMKDFENRAESSMNALSDMQERRMEQLHHQFEMQNDKFEARWDKRTAKVEKMFDKRADGLQHEMDLEEKQEQMRQRMFEAEEARISRLNELSNMQIDFSSAINTGNLDEAAKLYNDINSTQQEWMLEDAKAAEERASERRQASLQKEIDGVEVLRDKRLEMLQKIQERERKNLDRMQERKEKALQREQEAKMDAQKNYWDHERDEMERATEWIKNQAPQTVAEFNEAVQTAREKFGVFASSISTNFTTITGQLPRLIKENFDTAMDAALAEGRWEKVGESIANQLAQGGYDVDANELLRILATGNIPKSVRDRWEQQNPDAPSGGARHGGGLVNGQPGTRRGLAGAPKSDERMMLVQDGEYVVPKDTVNRLGVQTFERMSKKRGAAPVGGKGGGMGVFSKMMLGSIGISGLVGQAAMTSAVSGLMRNSSGSVPPGVSDGYVSGLGGKHRPIGSQFGITQGHHDLSTGFDSIDFGAPVGSPIFAAADGKVSKSYDITGYEPRNEQQNGFRSYGRVVVLDHGGFSSIYAHLNDRLVSEGMRVRGGSRIGMSGNTGHSTGPHLHFGASNGVDPYNFVSLRKGAANVKFDNTVANLHHGEAVLTKDLNEKFHRGVENFANGGTNEYNLTMQFTGDIDNKEEIAKFVLKTIETAEGRKPRRRTG